MSTYVHVPAEALFTRLAAAGFVQGVLGREVTFTRKHDRDPRLSVTVYTSCAVGSGDARGCGEDAIRVVAAFTWLHRQTNETRRKNLFKAKVLRVTSVEGVLQRTIDQAREAYRACNEFIKTNR